MVEGAKISARVPLLKSNGPGTPGEEAGAPGKTVSVYIPQRILTPCFSLSPQDSQVRYVRQRRGSHFIKEAMRLISVTSPR